MPAPAPTSDAPPVHFFLHVPKCAGTTVERHFERTLGAGFLLAPRWRHPLRDVIGNRYPSLSPADLTGVRAVSGHSLSRSLADKFPGRAVRPSVLIRDPVGFLVSFWNYRWMRHETRGQPAPPPFAEWRRTQRRNPITRFLLHRYFEIGYPALYRHSTRARFLYLDAAFTGFHFVGSYRRCDEALAGISAELGVDETVESENVGEAKRLRVADLSPEEVAEIETQNAADALLFARWKDRGFGDGAAGGLPAGALPAADAAAHLPDHDGLTNLVFDIDSAVRRKLWRR